MTILIFIGLLLLSGLVLVFLLMRLVQFVSLLAFGLLVMALGAVAGISALVSAVSLFGLYQLWGEQHAGWAILTSVILGLLVAASLIRALFKEVSGRAIQLKRWLGRETVQDQAQGKAQDDLGGSG